MLVRELIKQLEELDKVFHEIEVYRDDYENLDPVKIDKIEVRTEKFIARSYLKETVEEYTKTILVIS